MHGGGGMMYANHIGYSDVNPFEVVDYVSLKTLDIREMVATEKPWMRQFMAGGFLGHVVNQEDQDWDIQPDPDAPLVRIRKHKDGKWYDRHGARYALAEKPVKFHDFNF
jgi:hypothetical protein